MAERRQGKWVQRSEREWSQLLSRFGASGLGVEAFCRRDAISTASFYRWRGLPSDKNSRGDGRGHDTAPAFVDLGTLKSGSSAKPRIDLKLDLCDGLVLHLVCS
jgi:hypothetical protein